MELHSETIAYVDSCTIVSLLSECINYSQLSFPNNSAHEIKLPCSPDKCLYLSWALHQLKNVKSNSLNFLIYYLNHSTYSCSSFVGDS